MSKERRGEVSGIDKAIERVKKVFAGGYSRVINIKDVMHIITAYEESQRNVVHKNELLDWLQGEYDTANKQIAYLEKCNDYYEGNRSTHPSKEQTDE